RVARTRARPSQHPRRQDRKRSAVRRDQVPILRASQLRVDHDPDEREEDDVSEEEEDLRLAPAPAKLASRCEEHHETDRSGEKELIGEIFPVEDGEQSPISAERKEDAAPLRGVQELRLELRPAVSGGQIQSDAEEKTEGRRPDHREAAPPCASGSEEAEQEQRRRGEERAQVQKERRPEHRGGEPERSASLQRQD